MEHCPICSQPLVPFRAKLVCRTPGCGFMENCCDGGWMSACDERRGDAAGQCIPVARPAAPASPGDLSTQPPNV